MTWLLFDLNGTLLDPGEKLAELQQAVTLSMAETLSGSYRPFSDFIPDPPEPRLFDDVEPGLDLLRRQFRLAVLTNSSTADAEEKLAAVGIRDRFEFVAGTDQVKAFKPDPRVYRLGLDHAGVGAAGAVMVAAHAWDLLGAGRAGMRTAYLARDKPWPPMLAEPDYASTDLEALAVLLT